MIFNIFYFLKLILENNKLIKISNDFLQNFPHLKELDLSHNLLEEIDSKMFEGAQMLEQIKYNK